jgi:hypothetical protein
VLNSESVTNSERVSRNGCDTAVTTAYRTRDGWTAVYRQTITDTPSDPTRNECGLQFIYSVSVIASSHQTILIYIPDTLVCSLSAPAPLASGTGKTARGPRQKQKQIGRGHPRGCAVRCSWTECARKADANMLLDGKRQVTY